LFTKVAERSASDPFFPMSAELQTILALVVVVLAAAWLVRRGLAKRKNPGCGSDCGAVSRDVRRLQSHLAKRK
jgi:hypothetical protein